MKFDICLMWDPLRSKTYKFQFLLISQFHCISTKIHVGLNPINWVLLNVNHVQYFDNMIYYIRHMIQYYSNEIFSLIYKLLS